MNASEYVVEVLGGPSVFRGRALPTPTELRDRIKQGLPFRSLESVRERLGLSVPEAATMLRPGSMMTCACFGRCSVAAPISVSR